MLLKILFALLGSDNQKNQPQHPRKKSKSELSREKDRRDYELWVMSEEDRYDDGDE
jgi:hypothetical protein